MNGNLYAALGVSRRALASYYAKCTAAGQEIHTLQIWRGDECLVRIAPAPYSCTDRREVYSLSKTFCSTAIGCAVDEGLLSVDDRIVDLFTDKLPAFVSDNLAKMRVRHVLSMNTGHAKCVMPEMFRADDAARAFLALDVPYEPGTHFTYNTGASLLLSAIITRVTGESLYDYLSRKILYPLGIRDLVWNTCAEGINEGGVGVQVTSDEIIRLGRLYLNRGMWEGKRLLSEAWIAEASSFHSDNSTNGTPDWKSGYGYQIWVNSREGYRGDGAFGQLMMVFPERNLVAAVQGIVPGMQLEIDYLMELIGHLTDADAGEEELCLQGFAPAPTSSEEFSLDGWFRAEPNVFGWTALHLYHEDGVLMMDASDGRQMIRFTAGAGKYTASEYILPWRKPKLLSLIDAHLPEKIRTAAYYTVADGVCTITARHLCDPHTEKITLREENGVLTVQFAIGNMLAADAKEIRAKRISL